MIGPAYTGAQIWRQQAQAAANASVGQLHQRIVGNPNAIRPYHAGISGVSVPYRGPTQLSSQPGAHQQLNQAGGWSSLGTWGAQVNQGGDLRAATSAWEMAVSADDNMAGDNTVGFSGNPGTFSHAYFPVVFRFTNSGSISNTTATDAARAVTVVPFAVVASPEPFTSQLYFGLTPSYVAFNVPGSGVTINIDTNFCKNDTNLVLSALASALTFLPGRWQFGGQGQAVYLTIAPATSDADTMDFVERVNNHVNTGSQYPTPIDVRGAMSFGGASLGCAVAAAICGFPPMLYTGYLSSMGLDKVFYGAAAQKDALNAGVTLSALADVLVGATMVCSVDDVPFKVNYAIEVGMPIMIPLNTTWTTARMSAADAQQVAAWRAAERAAKGAPSMQARQAGIVSQALANLGQTDRDALANVQKINFASVIRDYVMTVQKLAAGKSFLEVGSLVLAASNYADMRMLACKYAGYVYNSSGAGGFAPDAALQGSRAAKTMAQQLEAKGMLKQQIASVASKETAAQKKAAKAAGATIPRVTNKKKLAANPFMTERKKQQAAANAAKAKAKAAAKKAAGKTSKAAVAASSSGKFKGGSASSGKKKVTAKAAGLMRASRTSRMSFLAPLADPAGYQFVDQTTQPLHWQNARIKQMALARSAAAGGSTYVPPPIPASRGGDGAPAAQSVGGSMFADPTDLQAIQGDDESFALGRRQRRLSSYIDDPRQYVNVAPLPPMRARGPRPAPTDEFGNEYDEL